MIRYSLLVGRARTARRGMGNPLDTKKGKREGGERERDPRTFPEVCTHAYRYRRWASMMLVHALRRIGVTYFLIVTAKKEVDRDDL